MERAFRIVVATLVAVLLLGAFGAFGFIYSGVYPIAAARPHTAPVRWVLTAMQENAVRRFARDVRVPELRDAELIRRGFVLYREECLVCHGAPGVARGRIGRGMNPTAPPLITEVAEWDDGEIYWIIENGLKMAGMPAFGAGLEEREIWALTAFTRRLPELSQEEYLAMVAWDEGALPTQAVEWVDDDDAGFLRMVQRGDPERGRELLDAYGCGACHIIPGVRTARGVAGPPLQRWAERHFIAGALVNTPEALIDWIVDPQQVEPGTVMPDLDVTPTEALHMARYLFSLGRAPYALHTVLSTQPRGSGQLRPRKPGGDTAASGLLEAAPR